MGAFESMERLQTELTSELMKRKAECERLSRINNKANQLILNENYSQFNREELMEIASMSASKQLETYHIVKKGVKSLITIINEETFFNKNENTVQ